MMSADPYGNESSLGHLPEGKRWAFDESVAACFEDMLKRSIPDYQKMRDLSTSMACHFAREGSFILDLGCSDGLSLQPVIEAKGDACRYVGVEVSAPMIERAEKRFEGMEGIVSIQNVDLRKDFPDVLPSVVLSIFTLQFLPIEYRQHILRRAYESMLKGGCLILAEKVIGACQKIDDLLLQEYLRMKGDHGYSQEEIERKRQSLEGVLVPVTASWNEEMLKAVGFRQVECFWRCLNFAAWVAIKE